MSESGRRFCDHCELPVGAGRVQRDSWSFCCLGCSVAFRLGGGRRREGGSEAASFLARIGLGAGFTMVTMLVQWVRYFDPAAAADPSYEAWAPKVQWITATPVMFVLGVPYLFNALVHLRNLSIGTDLLVGLGILAGYGISVATVLQGRADPLYFDTACALATLVTVGRWLEATAKRNATRGLRAFLSGDERPARRLGPGGEEQVAAPDLRVGDLVRVLPGERIPADGRVHEGEALLDEAALTGESRPRAVGPGDEVRAPTLPVDGPLSVRVERVGQDTLLAQVARVLERARGERAPAERIAERIAQVFVPGVLLLGVGVFLLDLRAAVPVDGAVLHALSILVVACPCALGIATPLAVAAALGRLAERGVLVRSGGALSDLPRVRRVAFDKTGTLTEGRPRLAELLLEPGVDRSQVLALAAAVESGSEHPLARGILEAARERGVEALPVEQVRVVPGRGVEGRVWEGGTLVVVRVGSASWLGLSDPAAVGVEREGRLLARLRLVDTARGSAAPALAALMAQGIHVSVLSGDAPVVVQELAAQLGLGAEQAQGGLLPDAKVQAIQALRRSGRGTLAFVGDGLNDAPALAAADLGIAVGSGTDLAKETADVSLLGTDLRRLPLVLEASRVVRRTVAWNLFWAFLYNGAAVAYAAWFGLPPALGALAMVASSLFVIGNSVRLRAVLPGVLGAALAPAALPIPGAPRPSV